MARSVVLNRGVLMVTLSLRWGSRRVEEGGRTSMTRLYPTRVCTCERHEGSVHGRVYMCVLATVRVHVGVETHTSEQTRAHTRTTKGWFT